MEDDRTSPGGVRPTLRVVAARAGVDVSTASRALRADPRISAATRSRVEAAAKEAGYRPNPYVTAFTTQMRRQRSVSASACLAVLDRADRASDAPWIRRYLDGIEAEAGAQGFAIDRLRLGAPGLETAGAVGRVIRARGIRGLLVMPVFDRLPLRGGVPFGELAVATIDTSLRRPALDRAMPDYFRGMQLALDELRRLGRRRIGFCSDRGELARIGRRWLGGYLEWHWERPGAERLRPHFAPPVRTRGAGAAAAARWRRMRDDFARWLDRERPDAVVSNLDYIPVWLRELGRDPAGDVLFATLGRDALGEFPGVDQRADLVAAAAVDLVSSRIWRNDYGLPAAPTTVLVPPAWRATVV